MIAMRILVAMPPNIGFIRRTQVAQYQKKKKILNIRRQAPFPKFNIDPHCFTAMVATSLLTTLLLLRPFVAELVVDRLSRKPVAKLSFQQTPPQP